MSEQRSDTDGDLALVSVWTELLAHIATPVIVTDLAGRVVIWGTAAHDLFGWSAEDMLGRPLLAMLLAPETEFEAVALLASAANGRCQPLEVECRRRDGALVPVRLELSAVHGRSGSPIGFVFEVIELGALRAAEIHVHETERLFRALLSYASEVACVMDGDGVVTQVFQTNETSLGYSPEERTRANSFDLVHPDDLVSVKDTIAATVADPTLHPTIVFRARARDDAWHWREARFSNHFDDPAINGLVCNIADVTEEQELIQDLRAANARQRAILAWSRDATMFFDGDGTIRWASAPTADLLGAPPEELIGRNGLELIHPDDRDRVFAEFSGIGGLGDHVRLEFRAADLHGGVHWIEEDVTNLLEDPDVGFIVVNVRDITMHKRDREELARLALHDALTGLPNRSLVVNRLEQLLARKSAVAILYIDLDNFGDVNDSLGHAFGDDLLRLVAARLATAVEDSSSTLARVGGDEFVLLCEDFRDVTSAFAYAELLRNSLRAPFHLDEHEVFIAASIGVALGPGEATALMRDAGIATHQAKQQGRDRVATFAARLDAGQQRRLAVQSELRRGIERGELRVWYQPMIDLRTGLIAGAEALVRWQHPERGLLGPEHFIDVAEASGMIRALGSQVLQQACADAHRWTALGLSLRLSINAAAAQLNDPDFVAEIEAALRDFDLDPTRLTLEITETAAMQISDSLATLEEVRRRGIHVALDDFGTGYSSLSFLRDLPVDAIKIDRAFISGLGTNERDTSIVEGVLAIASALGHAVVAEGVETEEQADALRRLDCPYGQGFLWSRAVPAGELERIVGENRRRVLPL